MTECLRCGKCCHIYKKGYIGTKCRFLGDCGDGKTFCQVYENRLGQQCSLIPELKGIKCILREVSKIDFYGCPYNTGKPYFE